jgi:hypothetical protein
VITELQDFRKMAFQGLLDLVFGHFAKGFFLHELNFPTKIETANQKAGFLYLFSDWLNFKKPKK